MRSSTKIQRATMVTALRQAMSRWSEKGGQAACVALCVSALAVTGCSEPNDERTAPRAETGVDGADSAPQQSDAGQPDGQTASDAPVDVSALDATDDNSLDADAMVEAADVIDDCPIVDGGCTDGCVPAHGSAYDPDAACYGPQELLVCFDQYETPPAQALPFEAPDGTCWIVYPPCHKLEEIGWDMSGTCDQPAPGTPLCP